MIGRFAIEVPVVDEDLLQMVESHRMKTGQDYGAILFFGLWGTMDCSPEVRLYAAYRHLEAYPEDGSAWLETARTHLEAGEVEQALHIVDELERLECPGLYPGIFSEDPEVHRALILADSGQLPEALELLDAMRERHDDSPVYHYILGSVLHAMADYPAAVTAYGDALEMLVACQREAEAEDILEEMNVDFTEAHLFIATAKNQAEKEQAFTGQRPLDLSGFREEEL